MAYKFQVGAATLSGSTKFEETLDAAGGIKLSGISAETASLNADSILFRDSDGTMKHESFADYATAVAGDGLAASNGVLAVGVDDSSIELNSDALRIKAAGVTDAMLNDDVATGLAGVGLGASSGVMALDLNELVAEQIASGDFLAFVDSTDNGTHKETVDDLATLFAGTGLAAASAVLSVDLNELSAAAVNVGNDSIAIIDADDSNGSKKESIADLMTAVAGNGLSATSGVLALDASEVADAAVASGDKFVFEDGTDNSTKKESIDDIATLFAGDGLAASSAVLSVNVDDSTIETNSDTLRLKDDGVTGAKLAPAVAGLGLAQDGSGNLDVQVSGAIKIASDKLGISGSIAGDGLAFAGGADSIAAISLSIPGMAQSMTGDVADTDEFAISDGGTMKKVDFSVIRDAVFADVSGDATVAAGGALTIGANAVEDSMVNDNVATGLAGVGLSAASGVMALDLNELSAADLASGDFLSFVDSNDSNKTRKESIDDIATLFAGSGLAASSAVLSVQVSGALKVASDKVGISGSFAGDGIKFLGGADSISSIELDVNELPAGAVADGDFFAFVDADDNSTKKEAVADLATLFAGAGLSAGSSVMAVVTGKGLEINSDAVRVKTASAGGLTRDAGTGNDELGLNLDGLGAAAVDVGADSIAIVDADDSDKTKKESIADLVTAMAGVGLTAASGVLRAGLDVAVKSDGNTLAVGMNYMADMGSDGEDTLNLPASAGLTVGDIIHVKAPSDCSQARTVKIARNGSQTIDGLTQVIIESPFGAVSMVYVAADTFRLI